MKLKDIALSYDTIVALAVTLVVCYFLPPIIRADFCVQVYYIGITVLAIIFALFFPAITVIMTTPDNKFIKFLEEKKRFTQLMSVFKFTLAALFISLGYSIIMHYYSQYLVTHINKDVKQSKVWFLIFVFSFAYSLVAAALSAWDAIMFSKYRIEFLNCERGEEGE